MHYLSRFKNNIFGLVILLSLQVAAEDLVDKVVAVVKNEPILYSDLQEAKALFVAEMKRTNPTFDFGTPKELDRKILDQLINDKLVIIEIQKLGMTVDEAAVDGGIKSIMQQNGMQSVDQLQAALRKEGIGWGEFRDGVKKQMEQSNFLNRLVRSKVRVEPEDIEKAYKQQYSAEGKSEKYHVRMIFRKKPGATKASMEKILQQVRSAKSFEQSAKKMTEGPAKDEGGDIGFVEPTDLQKDLGAVLEKMKVGEVSEVIEQDQGFYLLQLVEKKETVDTQIQSKKDQIREKLFKSEMDRIFDATIRVLREKANPQIYL